MVLGEALAQVVDIRVSNPLGALGVVRVTPHFAQVVGSHLVIEKFEIISSEDDWVLYDKCLATDLTLREEVSAEVRQTLWEMGAFGDCTADELSEGWKCPKTEKRV